MNVASHGSAASRRGADFGRRAAPMMQDQDQGCHFPAPQPMRVYCQPAPMHMVDGRPYAVLSAAYGNSRPLDRY